MNMTNEELLTRLLDAYAEIRAFNCHLTCKAFEELSAEILRRMQPAGHVANEFLEQAYALAKTIAGYNDDTGIEWGEVLDLKREAEALLRRMSPALVVKLPPDYVHPQGFAMGGYWAIMEGDRPIVVAKNREDLPV